MSVAVRKYQKKNNPPRPRKPMVLIKKNTEDKIGTQSSPLKGKGNPQVELS